MKEVTIILTPLDAEMFKKFQQFHDTFNILVLKGIFDLKNASVSLHFDSSGILQKIEREDVLYSRKAEEKVQPPTS